MQTTHDAIRSRRRHRPGRVAGSRRSREVEVAGALGPREAELEAQNEELRDANERLQRANAELVIARDRSRALHDGAPTALVTVDRRGVIVDINRAGEALLGARAGALIGAELARVVDEPARAALVAFLAGVFGPDRPRPIEVVLSPDGGRRVDVVIEGTVVHGADDAPRGLLAIVDVTARKLAELERHRLRDEILESVSHDVRGPLSAIGLAAAGLVGGVLDARGRKLAASIVRSTQRAAQLAQDLAEVARAENGRLRLAVAPVEARVLIEGACGEHELIASDAGVALVTSFPVDGVCVLVDADRIAQVLSNLIRNAFVHAPGSSVEVGATALVAEVVFTVADHGPGIRPDERDRIFERFWQGGHRRNGTGLGLAIARGIVDAHHGTISVWSEVGSGTRFEVRLPRCT